MEMINDPLVSVFSLIFTIIPSSSIMVKMMNNSIYYSKIETKTGQLTCSYSYVAKIKIQESKALHRKASFLESTDPLCTYSQGHMIQDDIILGSL